jgi:hypothetical protein
VKRWIKGGLATIALGVVLAGYFTFAFVLKFEVLGPPVRNNAYGWLGPTPRGSRCVSDIGKVNYWECEDISVFREHRTGCRVWLWANGVS